MLNKLYWEEPESIAQLTELLKNNQVCLGSSDTVLGLLAPANLDGARALDRLKKRGSKPYIILVNSKDKLEKFVDLNWSPSLIRLINHCWPGPLTLIFKLKKTMVQLFGEQQSTVALRIPDHAGLLNLLNNFDGLFSTSANLAGQDVPSVLERVDPDILNKVGAIVLDRSSYANPPAHLGSHSLSQIDPAQLQNSVNLTQFNLAQPNSSVNFLSQLNSTPVYNSVNFTNNLLINLPSTILDCSQLTTTGTGQIKVVRYGAYEVPVLEQIYGERFNC